MDSVAFCRLNRTRDAILRSGRGIFHHRVGTRYFATRDPGRAGSVQNNLRIMSEQPHASGRRTRDRRCSTSVLVQDRTPTKPRDQRQLFGYQCRKRDRTFARGREFSGDDMQAATEGRNVYQVARHSGDEIELEVVRTQAARMGTLSRTKTSKKGVVLHEKVDRNQRYSAMGTLEKTAGATKKIRIAVDVLRHT